MLDIASMAAVFTLVISVNGNLLTTGEANEGGVCLPLNLVHMRIPLPVSAFITAVEFLSATRGLNNLPTAVFTPHDARLDLGLRFLNHNVHGMPP